MDVSRTTRASADRGRFNYENYIATVNNYQIRSKNELSDGYALKKYREKKLKLPAIIDAPLIVDRFISRVNIISIASCTARMQESFTVTSCER